jgi:site-specific DNA-methyltransferase (adenine-specific)
VEAGAPEVRRVTWRILQGDCREVLRTLPAESVDACVADPPYGETKLDWDRWVDGWLPEVQRVLKPSGSLWCFGSLRFFFERAKDFADWVLVQDVVWEKHNGSNNASDRFKRVHELAVQFRPADRPWEGVYRDPQTTPDAVARQVRRKRRPPHWGNIGEGHYTSEDGGPRLMRSVIYARSCHGYAIHPTQKPVPVLEPLVRYSCPPGGLVLDPFAGSGAAGVAAVRSGRAFVGVELDGAMAEKARARLASDAPLLNAPAGRVA